MTEFIEKRTYDDELYDIVCSSILADGETIATIDEIVADQGGLTFGDGEINGSVITYDDGTVAQPGQVVQVRISGGAIPDDSDSARLWVPNLLCVIRVRFYTSASPTRKEATLELLLKDAP